MCNYLRKNVPNVSLGFTMTINKQHGIHLDRLGDFEFDLLIIPDSSSTDYEQHEALSKKGIDILVLDHHPASKESEYATIINPNLSSCTYPNKELSGVGVVYKFCQALDK